MSIYVTKERRKRREKRNELRFKIMWCGVVLPVFLKELKASLVD